MAIRLPRSFNHLPQKKSGASVLETQILAEHAASLGAAGRQVEKSLVAWRKYSGPDGELQESLLVQATDAVYKYLIQREAAGINNHEYALNVYEIPDQIMARIGVR